MLKNERNQQPFPVISAAEINETYFHSISIIAVYFQSGKEHRLSVPWSDVWSLSGPKTCRIKINTRMKFKCCLSVLWWQDTVTRMLCYSCCLCCFAVVLLNSAVSFFFFISHSQRQCFVFIVFFSVPDAILLCFMRLLVSFSFFGAFVCVSDFFFYMIFAFPPSRIFLDLYCIWFCLFSSLYIFLFFCSTSCLSSISVRDKHYLPYSSSNISLHFYLHLFPCQSLPFPSILFQTTFHLPRSIFYSLTHMQRRKTPYLFTL